MNHDFIRAILIMAEAPLCIRTIKVEGFK